MWLKSPGEGNLKEAVSLPLYKVGDINGVLF
jgi:hypothetical protein